MLARTIIMRLVDDDDFCFVGRGGLRGLLFRFFAGALLLGLVEQRGNAGRIRDHFLEDPVDQVAVNGFLTRMLGRIRVDAPTPQLSQQREILAHVMAVLVILRRAARRGAVLAEDRAITVAATACFAFEGFTTERLATVAMIDAHFFGTQVLML